MTPGKEVRLKNAYIVMCTGCDKDADGNITAVHCTYDPDTRTGLPGSNRKVKGTIHWVSCAHCLPAEVRLYDRLWTAENPRDELAAIREAEGCDALTAMKRMINPDSLRVLTGCYVEKVPRHGQARRLPPVPTHRLLHARPRHHARASGVQPHRVAQGQLGQGNEEIRPPRQASREKGYKCKGRKGKDNNLPLRPSCVLWHHMRSPMGCVGIRQVGMVIP